MYNSTEQFVPRKNSYQGNQGNVAEVIFHWDFKEYIHFKLRVLEGKEWGNGLAW